MKLTQVVAFAAVAMTVSGCATVKSWFVEEEQKQQEQITKVEPSHLALPTGFTDPKKSDEFEIQPGAVAIQEEYITSPTMVLTFFEGSWVNADDAHKAKIMVEKPNLVKDLPAFIDQGVKSFVAAKQYKSEKTATGYRITSSTKVETGFWFWKTQQEVETFQYDLNIAVKPHGRSGEIYVNPVTLNKLNNELASKQSKRDRVETLSAKSLNDFMLELDYLYRVQLKKEQASLQLTLTLDKDTAGNSVIISQKDIGYVWKEIDDLLEELGFNIEEDDEDLYILELSYDKTDVSMWDSLFSSEYSFKLNLPTDKYELALVTTTSGVQLKFRDKNSQALDEETVRQIFELLKAVVEEDELEI